MGDLELSLDDIIKKKNNAGRNRTNGVAKRGLLRRPIGQNNRPDANANRPFPKARGSILKTARGLNAAIKTMDARLKIIQKKRAKIVDAREKLANIAKQTDARMRLIKLRERRSALGSISMVARTDEQLIQRTIRPNVAFEDELMDFTKDLSYMNRNYSDRPVSDEEVYNYQFRTRQDLPLIYRTVENDVSINRLSNQDQNRYTWKSPKSPLVGIDDLNDVPSKRIDARPTHTATFKNEDSCMWDYDDPPIVITKKVKPAETIGILKRSPVAGFQEREPANITKESPPPGLKMKGPAKTLSERFCQDGNPSAHKINLLKARLEASESTKIQDEKEQEALGHRIVVSNLVPSVTHEDVRELFEDIGELLSSKVVRPGTAEVVYKLHKDAVKAVDVYHNRQLDGQPMKCLLVNNRSLPMAPKASRLAERKTGKGIVELDMTAFRKALHKKSTP